MIVFFIRQVVFLANDQAMATPLAGANVDRGVEVV